MERRPLTLGTDEHPIPCLPARTSLDERGGPAIVVMGVNYRTAPVALREQFAVPSFAYPEALSLLRRSPAIDEAVILSTCNRVECYVASTDPAAASADIVNVLSHRSRLAPSAFQPHLYARVGRDAIHHLFRVTAGLDAMILGESEIAAQVKHAYLTAHAQGATGPMLNRLFQKAMHSSKVIRTSTRLAEGHASIGSVIASLAGVLFGERLADCDVLLWGAGKAAEVTVRHLHKSGIRQLWVVNRTQEKAEALASLCQGQWLSWERALAHLAHVDIAIICTQAPHYVVDEADLAAIWSQRRGRPLFIMDLAVPRNVDPVVGRREGIHLYNIDDLHAIARAGLAQRRQELERCAVLIEEQVGRFWSWWNRNLPEEVVPCAVRGAHVIA